MRRGLIAAIGAVVVLLTITIFVSAKLVSIPPGHVGVSVAKCGGGATGQHARRSRGASKSSPRWP